MRALRILSGIAVLLNALHFIHAIHHFYSLEPVHGAVMWLMLILAVVIDALSFTGGYLLLRPPR
jgi:hypothetical protein